MHKKKTCAEKKKKKRRRSDSSDDELSIGEIVFAVLCNGLGVIVGVIWMIQGNPKGTKMFILSLIITIIGVVLQLALSKGRF